MSEEEYVPFYLADPELALLRYWKRYYLVLPKFKVQKRPEKGFYCMVRFSIRGGNGQVVRPEATERFRRDAIRMCALQACRILDRHGLMQRTYHEETGGRRRKQVFLPDAPRTYLELIREKGLILERIDDHIGEMDKLLNLQPMKPTEDVIRRERDKRKSLEKELARVTQQIRVAHNRMLKYEREKKPIVKYT